MKKNLLLISALLLMVTAVRGQAFKPFNGYPAAKWPSKTAPEPDDYRLSHDDFVTQYGVNDTAAAIIHIYLRRHYFGKRLAQGAAGLGSGAGAVARTLANAEAQNQAGPGQAVSATDGEYPGWAGPVVFLSAGTALWGVIHAGVWSRRQCYLTLYQYHTIHQLPGKVRRRLPRYLVKTQNRDYGD